MRRFRWYCHRCGITQPVGSPSPAEACALGVAHYDLTHRDQDTALMEARA